MMPSGWEDYYVVFLSAVLALLIPLILSLLSLVFSSKRAPSEVSPSSPREVPPPMTLQRVNTRFFLGANAALVLITLGLALIPCVGTLKSSSDNQGLLRGLVSIVTITGFASLGLLYSARKGDLGWLRTFRKDPKS